MTKAITSDELHNTAMFLCSVLAAQDLDRLQTLTVLFDMIAEVTRGIAPEHRDRFFGDMALALTKLWDAQEWRDKAEKGPVM